MGRWLLLSPWFVLATGVPAVAYWLLEPAPMELVYVHPLFVSHEVGTREEAKAAEVHAVRGGAVVYRFIEYTVKRPYTAKTSRAWVTKAMVWNAPDFSTVLSREPGHHHRSVAIDVPTSSPTRDMQFVQTLSIPVNWLRTVEIEYPPIPLRVLSPADADALQCMVVCQ